MNALLDNDCRLECIYIQLLKSFWNITNWQSIKTSITNPTLKTLNRVFHVQRRDPHDPVSQFSVEGQCLYSPPNKRHIERRRSQCLQFVSWTREVSNLLSLSTNGYFMWMYSITMIGSGRKPENRISRIFPPTIAVCWLYRSSYFLSHPETESAVTFLTDS